MAGPAVIIAVPPSLPGTLVPNEYAHAEVFVRVRLAANSAVVTAVVDHAVGIANNGATVAESFDTSVLRTAAVEATKRSVFVTQTVHCRPQASEYMFIAEFD